MQLMVYTAVFFGGGSLYVFAPRGAIGYETDIYSMIVLV